MYLLDTDTLSNLFRPVPSTALIARLASIPSEQQFTSSITVGELFYGAYRLGTSGASLLERIEDILSRNRRVISFDAASARRYGEVRVELERRGTPLPDADLRIAAIAFAGGLTVVTWNLRRFQRVPGLTVENWLT